MKMHAAGHQVPRRAGPGRAICRCRRGPTPTATAGPTEPLPLVLNVHGGPWARDDWGFDAEHQLLANRGYAVLSVNFRGSTGFGKNFVNAGNKEWAGKMHDDLLDAVDWAVTKKIADPKRIAIIGGSYGGYATLVGLTFTPDVFACGVDIVGPVEHRHAAATRFRPTGQPADADVQGPRRRFHHRRREEVLERAFAADIRREDQEAAADRPGRQRPARQAEPKPTRSSRRCEANKIPVTYVLYPDEGHGFARPENRLSFYAVTEAFLPSTWAAATSRSATPLPARPSPCPRERIKCRAWPRHWRNCRRRKKFREAGPKERKTLSLAIWSCRYVSSRQHCHHSPR